MSENKDYSATYNMGQEILRLEAKVQELESQLEQAKKDQARYLKLIETESFCPTKYHSLWGLHMNGTPYTKAELDAPIDAAMQENQQ